MPHGHAGAMDWQWRAMTGKHERRRESVERALALRQLVHGPFGAGPLFGPPFGGRGRGRGRKRRGDVRAALLLALAEEPRNGYQLMQVIEERSDGRWRPSPGSVYPALAQLEDEGLIRSVDRDGSKVFEITDAGRRHLEERAGHAPPWELDEDPESDAMSELRSMIAQLAAAAIQVSQVADERQMERAGEVLTEARRALYRILAEDTAPGAPADDPAPGADA